MATPEELAAAGLYDPTAPDAHQRLALLRALSDYGVTADEMAAWDAEHQSLHVLAARRFVRGGREELTLAEAAGRADVDLDDARAAWRALGLADPSDDARPCSELDVEAFTLYRSLVAFFGCDTAFQLLRTLGAAMARLADAEIGAVRSVLEAPLRSGGAGDPDVARAFGDVAAELMPRLARGIEAVHRQHLLATGPRYALWGMSPNEGSLTDTVIGFADLVGFTRLSGALSTTELDRLMLDFEQRAEELLARPNARLVKLIGDEVMFAVGDSDAADVALGLAATVEHHPGLPSLRVGLAAGPVLAREGDYFGPTVNLASRLVKLADPGSVVVSADTARRVTDAAVPVKTRSLGTREVAGFDEPVEVFELTRLVDS